MISKRVPMKSARKSDFAGLVKYILDSQQKQERVLHHCVTNCHSPDPLIAAIEVLNTQAQNKRAVSDKTYHLIISFRPEEVPGLAVLSAIESRICEALGYGVHQRVSAVHHDTDNLHVHVAINKIHPTRYTLHEPYNDYRIRDQLCEELELEFGLQQDNHRPLKHVGENRAADMERHSGIESLLGWIQRECLPRLLEASTWKNLHESLRDHGLELRLQGSGLIVSDGAGTSVKASSVARRLSKPKLEERLGPFQPALTAHEPKDARPSRGYKPKPMHSRTNTADLYARYQAEQGSNLEMRAKEWTRLRDETHRLVGDELRGVRLKRAAIKLLVSGRLSKKLLYKTTSRTLKAQVRKIKKEGMRRRAAVTAAHRRLTWADWLRSRAAAGDAEALAALRARRPAPRLTGNTVSASGARAPALKSAALQDGVTKKGTVIYRVGATAVRDDGERLSVSRDATPDGLAAALRLARDHYGERITVNGTGEFKERVVTAAAAARLPITFDDAGLERRRQALSATIDKEISRDNPGRRRPVQPSARVAQRGNGARYVAEHGAEFSSTDTPGRGSGRKPDIARIGRHPPPESQNRLRGLSELSVVRLACGGEVLLPRDVPRDMEQQRAESADGVRRDVSRSAGLTPTASQIADQYVAEREEKRVKVTDIKRHVRFAGQPSGPTAYGGIRRLQGQSLALLNHDDQVLVMPVDEATARRLSRVSLGEQVTVTSSGTIKAKGRSR